MLNLDPAEKGAEGAATVSGAAQGEMAKKVLYIATGFAGVVLGGSIILAIGENAETKQSMFKWGVIMAGSVMITALSVLGYSVGKLLNGVVPAGFLPATQAFSDLIQNSAKAAQAAQPKPSQMIVNVQPPAVVPPVESIPIPQTPDARDVVNPSISKTLPAILLLILPFVAGGCVGTSKQFQFGVAVPVNNVVIDMREYNAGADWDSNHNGEVDAAEQEAKDAESALTESLAESVKDQNAITVDGVSNNWNPIKPLWENYIASDPLLKFPGDAKIRLDTGRAIDLLIKVEKERQSSLLSAFGISE